MVYGEKERGIVYLFMIWWVLFILINNINN